VSCKVLITASTQSHIRHFHLSYLRWFRRQGWKVHVACAGVNAPLPEADQTIDLPLKKKMYALQNFQAAAILRKKICRERYDLIITHTALAAFFTRLAVKGMKNRPRVINVVHGYLFDHDTAGLKRMMLSAAEWLTKEQTDLLLTMNRWDQNYASQKKLGSTVMQIPGIGVDFSAFDRISRDAAAAVRRQLQIDEGKYMLLYAAEFSERKNQAALLRAMSHLPE